MIPQYSVVRFSPNPEEIERVGVAIYLWSTRQMIFDHEFPRLCCLAPGFNTSLLLRSLRFLEKSLAESSTDTFDRVLPLSPQFHLEPPRTIGSTLPDALEILRWRYLGKGREAPAENPRGSEGRKHLETKLQTFLTQTTGIPESSFLKRASPASFLSHDLASRLAGDKIVIPRVLNGRDHLVTIDAINLAVHSPKSIIGRAALVAYNFFRIGQLRAEIEKQEHRELMRIVVVLDGENHDTKSQIEYVQRDADLVESDLSPSPALKNQLIVASGEQSFEFD